MILDTETSPGLNAYIEDASARIIDWFGCYKEAKSNLLKVHAWPVSISPRTITSPYDIDTSPLQIFGCNIPTGAQLTGIIFTPTDTFGSVTIVPAIEPSSWEEHIYASLDTAATEPYELERQDAETQQRQLQEVSELVDDLCESALETEFEDGMMSNFSRGLFDLVLNHGYLAMQQVTYLITNDILNPNVSSEALRWLGRIDDASTYNWRLWLLEKSLNSKFPQIRDGAALGLGSMCDPHSIQYLENAISREPIIELRQDLAQILEDIKAASKCRSS